MTFTKEKLQQLDNAIYDTIHGLRIGDPNPRDVDLVVQAATLLPHYITALAEAERALDLIARDYIELSHEKIKVQRDDYMRYAKEALTTISQLARPGKPIQWPVTAWQHLPHPPEVEDLDDAKLMLAKKAMSQKSIASMTAEELNKWADNLMPEVEG
jgi:hypothetical protein